MEKLAAQDVWALSTRLWSATYHYLERQKNSDEWSDTLRGMTDGEKAMQACSKSLQAALAFEPRHSPMEKSNLKDA
jgi:hypothetical protein